jgi:hypothetical protein
VQAAVVAIHTEAALVIVAPLLLVVGIDWGRP